MEIIYEKSRVKNYMKEDAIDTTFVVAKRKLEEIQACTRFELLKENIFELDMAATVHNSSTYAPPTNSLQPSFSSGFFSNFELLSKDSVNRLMLSVPTKSCSLDPVKESLDEFVPLPAVVIISQSLQSGVCSGVWKERSWNSHAKEVWF